MSAIESYVNFWKKYIEIERNEEKSLHIEEIYKLWQSREKRQKAVIGLKWKVLKDLDDISLIRFWKKQPFETQIKEQDVVVLLPSFFYKFKNNWLKKFQEQIEKMPLGIVDFVWKQFIDVWVNKPYPVWVKKTNIDLHLFVNDVTFKRQEEWLDRLRKNYKKFNYKFLIENWDWQKDKIVLLKKPKVKNLDKVDNLDINLANKNINEFQYDFVIKSMFFKYFLLLHWPFWTGKTTTLVETILQNINQWKKVLVTADSNTAVDNILARLAKYDFLKEWDIVRVGPYTRLIDKISDKALTIYDLIEKHPSYKKVRQLTIQIDKLKKQQLAYKRPNPSIKRWMTDDQIHYFALVRKSYRGVKSKTIVQMSKWLKIQEQINEIFQEREFLKQQIQDDIVNNAKIVLSTNTMCFSDFLKDKHFDIAVIDEGTQATEPSTLLPILLADKFIIGGDHKQLPPTVLSDKAKPLQVSMFERLINLFEEDSDIYSLLRIQYRMNETLMQFPNKMFYKWKLKTADFVKNISLKDLIWEKEGNFLRSDEVLYWFNVKWNQQQHSITNSIYNLEEIELIKNLVNDLLNFWLSADNIWIISPYSAQVQFLKQKISNIEINTVDWFQWREKEVIIISWVRNKELGFLVDYRRLNVAITRAKRLLINVWNLDNLSKDKIFNEYGSYIKNVGKFVVI